MRADMAVEPTKSENITVTWRRSAVSCGRGLAGMTAATATSGSLFSMSLRSAMARSSLRRCPSDATPTFSRS